jgi:hypothetical protein
MGYLVEKQIFSPTFHPSYFAESWIKKDDKMDLEDTKKSAIEFATKIEKEKYRVRDIHTDKIHFNVSS